ncbi:MAG: alanine-zipper protein [Defluviitaleaceae bacterium]|nr:alanine-zipper protein [Defluviitaleaceae bacterium]
MSGKMYRMSQQWNNNVEYWHGHAAPPIVLHSKAEQRVAQNAHNLVWRRLRAEHDGLTDAYEALRKDNEDLTEIIAKIDELHKRAQCEIDGLIKSEITAYRVNMASSGGTTRIAELEDQVSELLERIDDLESRVDEAYDTAQDAQNTAEEAQNTAEEARDLAQSISDNNGDE